MLKLQARHPCPARRLRQRQTPFTVEPDRHFRAELRFAHLGFA
ncbi:MAG: hypothetical protein NZ874_03570 [Fimbriimonadales bacterium]|nr:hypothetical protein [Fimbriimonadales bacterium]